MIVTLACMQAQRTCWCRPIQGSRLPSRDARTHARTGGANNTGRLAGFTVLLTKVRLDENMGSQIRGRPKSRSEPVGWPPQPCGDSGRHTPCPTNVRVRSPRVCTYRATRITVGSMQKALAVVASVAPRYLAMFASVAPRSQKIDLSCSLFNGVDGEGGREERGRGRTRKE